MKEKKPKILIVLEGIFSLFEVIFRLVAWVSVSYFAGTYLLPKLDYEILWQVGLVIGGIWWAIRPLNPTIQKEFFGEKNGQE
jgi:hypothetical protein